MKAKKVDSRFNKRLEKRNRKKKQLFKNHSVDEWTKISAFFVRNKAWMISKQFRTEAARCGRLDQPVGWRQLASRWRRKCVTSRTKSVWRGSLAEVVLSSFKAKMARLVFFLLFLSFLSFYFCFFFPFAKSWLFFRFCVLIWKIKNPGGRFSTSDGQHLLAWWLATSSPLMGFNSCWGRGLELRTQRRRGLHKCDLSYQTLYFVKVT